MEKVRLGKTELVVSRIGFGGIPIQRLSEPDSIEVVRHCLDLGINFIDTSHAYTTSEERIGKAIEGRRDEIVIATKTDSRNPDGVQSDLETSLRRLSTDYIDLYQFHNVSDLDTLMKVLEPGGITTVIDRALKAGKVRHIGLTSHSLDVAKVAIEAGRFETVMVPFNFIMTEANDEVIPLARACDMGTIAMKPLAGGMIKNAIVAFKYVLQHPGICPLVGIQKSDEIDEIVRIVESPHTMNKEELLEMERLRKELGKKFCHNCNYCQPCLQEIPISRVLLSRSGASLLPPERFFSDPIKRVMDMVTKCTKCGECESRCPYQIPIRERLEEEAKWYWDARRHYLEHNSVL